MKTILVKVLVYLKFVTIGHVHVERWIAMNNIDLLLLALDMGRYPIRISAIKGLEKLNYTAVIPRLLLIARKDFEVVSEVALSAAMKLNMDANDKYTSEILKVEWQLKNRKESLKKRLEAKKKSLTLVRFSTQDMPRLVEVKQMLKRSYLRL